LFPFLRFLGVGSKVDGIGKDKSESVSKIKNRRNALSKCKCIQEKKMFKRKKM